MRLARRAAVAFLITIVGAGAALAQPYGMWMSTSSTTAGFIEVPNSLNLNPQTEMTVELWTAVSTPPAGTCQSLVGKSWLESWWVGVCGGTLRSYHGGADTLRNGGTIPSNQWTHVAVTIDSSQRRHYINGELVGQWPEPTPLTASPSPVRIGSDVQWMFTPDASFDEVRIWSKALSINEIRQGINVEIDSAAPDLVAAWNMDGGTDALGNHDGNLVGAPGFLTFPVTLGCEPTETSLCLKDRFSVTVRWTDFLSNTGAGTVVPCGSSDTGLFWFFSPDNWELMVKVLNGCDITDHWWVFSAATTNVGYRLEVLDVVRGANKIYFNYLGESAPAITDTKALETCL